MDDIKRNNDSPPLTIDQIRDLATAVRDDFGPGLSRAGFTDNLLFLLEDVPGFEAADFRTSESITLGLSLRAVFLH